MKILFTIIHYYNPAGEGRYGSVRKNPQPRIEALRACIGNLHCLFGDKQFNLDISTHSANKINTFQRNELKIIILTIPEYNLLDKLNLPATFYTNKEVRPEPIMLGFEAKKVFEENAGMYDYYCYLEDDLIINDPLFFVKLNMFNKMTDDGYLIQPNRYEIFFGEPVNKAYIDGNLKQRTTEKFQNISDSQTLTGNIITEEILFKRTLNPHSGCYFLNENQLNIWKNNSYFSENDTSFIGPLESAATLGIMKTFKVYKPEPQSFLEIMHYGTSYLGLIGNKVKKVENKALK